MRVHSIRVENYGPFAALGEVRLGTMATIIGKNDVGKSHILLALQQFFNSKSKLEPHDVHDGADKERDALVLEVAFTDLPGNITLPDGTVTTLQAERLVDNQSLLRIRKSCTLAGSLDKFELALVVHDFADDRYAKLATLSDRKLDDACKASGALSTGTDGSKLTPSEKRQLLRQKATEAGIGMHHTEVRLTTRDDLWKMIESMLPQLNLFVTETRLGIGETTFQSQFRPIVRDAVEEPAVADVREAFTSAIEIALQGEVDAIFSHLTRHTDVLSRLNAEPSFAWDKAVTFDIVGEDQHGVRKSLDKRGSGMRRLLMVAYFQYLAEKTRDRDANLILAVEEPENCLHPGLQRELAASFRELAEQGVQVIVTSHSPVFAGASPIDDLVLIERVDGAARAVQPPDPAHVAEQLGVEPADSITGFNACVFVEGPDDILFWNTVATRLKADGLIPADLKEKRIGLLPAGGDNLKHWVNVRALGRLSRRFAVIMDSDRTKSSVHLSDEKVLRQKECEAQGGMCFISRKREIENYLHPEAIRRHMVAMGRTTYKQKFDDFTDMKDAYGKRIIEAVKHMSSAEILSQDRYEEDGVEHHELKEIIEALLELADGTSAAHVVPALVGMPITH